MVMKKQVLFALIFYHKLTVERVTAIENRNQNNYGMIWVSLGNVSGVILVNQYKFKSANLD